MIKQICIECDGKRDPYFPAIRTAEGMIRFVCRQCWRQWGYAPFMHPITETDHQAMRTVGGRP